MTPIERNKSLALLVLPCLALAISSLGCRVPAAGQHATRWEFMPRYVDMELDGDASITEPDGFMVNSSGDDIGFGSEGAFMPRIDYVDGPVHTTLSHLGVGFGGMGTADFGYLPNLVMDSPVASDLDIQLQNLAVTWDIVPDEVTEVGLGLGFSRYRYELISRALDFGGDVIVKEDETNYAGFAAARLGWHNDRVAFEALGQWCPEAVDVDVMVRIPICDDGRQPRGFFAVGYRHIKTTYDGHDDGYDYHLRNEFSSPWLGFVIAF